MLLDEALWKVVGDLLEAALQTRAGDWRLLAREVPAVSEAVAEERWGAAGDRSSAVHQGWGWKSNNLLLQLSGSATRGLRPRGSPCLSPWLEVGAPPGYSLFPSAVLRSKAVLSWLCCTLGGSPASWRAAFPCLAAGKLNIYVWPQLRVRCKRQHQPGMG